MPKPTPDRCRRLKTAIAEESGNIQAMSERFIKESDNYLVNRITQGTFDAGLGEDPVSVRYATAPIPDREYVDLLTSGHNSENMMHRGEDGGGTYSNVSVDRRGAMGCNLPGQGISAGYDEFTRVLKGKAWETDPACALDLILKKHYNPYIDMLRTDLPMRAQEQFVYSLERNVIEVGKYNLSIVDGFIHSEGAFPAVPTSRLQVGHFKRLIPRLRAQGWTGTFEVGPISESAFERMRLDYKNDYNVELQATLVSPDTHHLPEGTRMINWAGINWIISDYPTRGYLETQANGTLKFVPVRPAIARDGTGEGVVSDIDDDWFNCRATIDGVKRDLYEVAYYVHPTAATREAFAPPQVAGKRWENNLFNFSVRMLDGNWIDCNEDNFKFKFRLLHAYAFDSRNPERMGAVIYRVAPEELFVHDDCENEATPTEALIGVHHPENPVHDACSESDMTDCNPLEERQTHIDPLPTEDNPLPAVPAGVVRLQDCGTLKTEADIGTIRIYVERTGGSTGAASVDIATADGTATTASNDYTAVSETLNWADGENDRKWIDIPIGASGSNNGQSFAVTISNASGATLADGATTGCATLNVQIGEA